MKEARFGEIVLGKNYGIGGLIMHLNALLDAIGKLKSGINDRQ